MLNFIVIFRANTVISTVGFPGTYGNNSSSSIFRAGSTIHFRSSPGSAATAGTDEASKMNIFSLFLQDSFRN